MTTKIGNQDSHQFSRDVKRARLKSEDQLRLFYDQDLVGLTITSPEKGWIRVNEHLCRMLEYSEQELRRMTWEQLTHPDDLAADGEQFDKLLAHEIDGYRLEKRFITRSGKVVPTNLVVRCVRKDSGAIDYVTAMVEDITEQEQAKKAQSESEQRYRTLVEWTPESIIVHRRANILYVNPAALKMFGASSVSELIGTSLLDRVHPDFYQVAVALMNGFAESDSDSPMVEQKFLRLDGTVIDVEIQGMAISYQGETARQASLRDVTERKRVEAALKDSEQRYRTLVEWTPEPLIVHRNREILYLNPAAVTLFGAGSAQELVGESIVKLISPDSMAAALERESYFIAHGFVSRGEQRFCKIDGTPIDVEVQSSSISYDGAPAVHVALRDITASKAVEATLEAARLKAENASQAKSRFLASASHDLRQPAHALGMFVARLAQMPHDAHTRHLVDSMDASVRAMQDMLDGLFDISRLDSDQTQISRVAFPIESILGQLRGSLSSAASDKGLHLRIRPSQAWVESDPGLLHRILLNLVSNAVRYTQQGSVLVVCRPTHDRTQLRIEVRDSGVGIAPEHHEAIFQEFFQVGNPQRDRSKGLGVGLNIVERACRLLDHPLAMRSTPGCGSCFSVTLPLMQARATETYEDSNESAAQKNFNGLHVLLIEDDAMGRVGLASLLTSWGCSVTQAEGAQAACELYRGEQAPELIISDVRLGGGINGIEAVELLNTIAGRRIVACLISGDTDANVKAQAQAAGLTLLQKPVRPAKLRSLIRHLVTARSVQ
jgi:PAS domain S-box-containing protein